jgi:protein SCO1
MKKFYFIFLPFFLLTFLFGYFFIEIENEKDVYKIDFISNTTKGKYNFEQSNGKIRLVYFGFVSCPDFCPTTLQKLSKTFAQLNQKSKDKLEIIFIDLDPERDSPELIMGYVNNFLPGVIPIHDSIENLENIVKLFGAFYSKVPIESHMGYTVDHSTSIYIVNPDGYLIDKIPYKNSDEDVKNIIMKYLNKYFETELK